MSNHHTEVLDALPIVVIEIDEGNKVRYLNQAARTLLIGDDPSPLPAAKDVADFFATQEVLGLIGAYEAAETSLRNTNVLFLDAAGVALSHAVTGVRLTSAQGANSAVLVAERNSQLQEELAESSRWAAAEQNRADELSRIRDALQESHDRLREMQTQLMQASRLAGMAEIASGVIHNVGNVLNGVNVGVKLTRDKLSASRMSKLGRLCVGLKEQFALPEHDRDTKRLASLLGYFDEVVHSIDNDRTSMLESLDAVLQKIEHIKNVVGSQQIHAPSGEVCEKVSLRELVEQALALQRSERSERIEMIQELGDVDEVEVDRHNFLQILVNLLKNAEDSMIENDTPIKRITLAAHTLSQHDFEIHVSDTGIGIDKELQARIFAHGFTTRKNGNGFGLHNAALLAKKMSGQIGVTSEGLGTGATFWLKLPLHPRKVAA